MLNEKYLQLELNYKNYEYYRDLGYEFTDDDVKIKNKIAVLQSDISHGFQKIQIEYTCDCCGKNDCLTTPYNYYRSRKILDMDFCNAKACKKVKKDLVNMKLYGTTDWGEIAKINGYHLGRSRKYNIDDIIHMASLKNHIIISEFFGDITTKDKIILKCNKHNNIFDTNIGAYMEDDAALNCPLCRGEYLSEYKSEASIEDAIAIAIRKDYTIITEDIKNCDDVILYYCNKHKDYGLQKTSYWGLKHYEKNCRLCHQPRGENHYNWKGGVSNENDRDNDSYEYNRWRKSVFLRDNYTCQCCERSGCKLNAHHIKNYSSHKDIRYDVSNGITLCEECHLNSYNNSFHKIYGNCNNDEIQLQEYLDIRRKELNLPLKLLNDILNE